MRKARSLEDDIRAAKNDETTASSDLLSRKIDLAFERRINHISRLISLWFACDRLDVYIKFTRLS